MPSVLSRPVRRRSVRRGSVAAAAALGLLASPLALGAAPASAVPSTGLVISEVYPGGGNSGATYNADYVELYNSSTGAINLAGKSLQYRSGGGTGVAANVFALPAVTVPAGSYFLVRGSSGTSGAALPVTPDATSSLALGASSGQIYLADTATGIDPVTPAGGTVAAGGTIDYSAGKVIDFVGYGPATGTTAVSYEGSRAAALSATTTAKRNGTPPADTDNNATDFTVDTTFTPRACDCATDPDPDPDPDPEPAPVRTIPEIQGTGPTSPLMGATVDVTGVVTASFPAADQGGLNGFYIQTPGHDPAADATPQASDGLFVYTGTSSITAVVGTKVTLASARVGEFSGQTQVTVTDPASVTQVPATAAERVTPGTVVPGTDCPLPGDTCLTGEALSAERERHEGELFLPAGPHTVTDSYDGSPFTQLSSLGSDMLGEIGLAMNSTLPLIAPTQVANPTEDPEELAARNRYNAAHMLVLDDGAAVDHVADPVEDTQAFPWFTREHTVRMGAAVEFEKPFVLGFRDTLWRLEPQTRIEPGDDGEEHVSIEQDRPTTPEDVGGDLTIATFNVLNYFNTTGEEYVAAGGSCDYYTDRAGNPITNRECDQPDPANPGAVRGGPRGAANEENFQRQQAKIVRAINTMDADVLGLEEVENSVALGEADRDDALSALVDALNADWAASHPGAPARWAFAPSPPASEQPPLAGQDVIRAAFIYNPQVVELHGASRILVGSQAFSNAREPLAQAFKAPGATDAQAFGVIVNHFKSKGGSGTGDNADTGNGAGSFNGDRIRQAQALVAFADEFRAERGMEAVFLAGDFNAYSQEDPVHAIEDAGYEEIVSDFASATEDELTYAFGGLAGSLDHVFANAAAAELVTGADVYDINANESVYYEYSRFNANVADLYAPDQYRSSDHNPEIIGIRLPSAEVVSTTVAGSSAPYASGTAGSVEVTVTPGDATGTVQVSDGARVLGSATVSAGRATVAIPAGALGVGTHQLTLTYSGDATHAPSTGTVTVTVTKASVTVTASVAPASVPVVTGQATITVSATSAGGTPAGTVGAYLGDRLLAQADLVNGTATLPVGPFDSVGTKVIEVRYAGNDSMQASAARVTLTVTKQAPTMTVDADRDAEKGKKGGVLVVELDADGYVPTGTVRVVGLGGDYSREVVLRDGRAVFTLPKLKKGASEFSVKYLGDDRTLQVSDTVRIRVKGDTVEGSGSGAKGKPGKGRTGGRNKGR